MLAYKLIEKEKLEQVEMLAYLEKHSALLNMFGMWLFSMGGVHDRFGKFVESIVLHQHGTVPTLRLQLCCNIIGNLEVINQIIELERCIGQHLNFNYREHDYIEADYYHPKLGKIIISVSNCDMSIFMPNEPHDLLEAA